ncbi:MAG: flagellar basal body P-ring formation chaperone FlgA [Motiliproteus sp.]|nr:flagellar basal body P-ring formation chaperone FlgA [Motiliproteus sp.]MCW9051979.1 flagellar basal body P-ring formation chaperone FlgA [Motiliproteus sp.]
MIKGSLKPFKILLFVGIVTIYPCSGTASPTLEQQAQNFIQQQIAPQAEETDLTKVVVQPVSSHLTLTPCRDQIQFNSAKPIRPGRFSIKASCNSPRRWTVSMRGQVDIMRHVVVSQRPLPKDTVLELSDLELELKGLSRLRNGYYSDPKSLIGYELKRSLQQHQILTPRLLLPPLLVRKDEQVIIHAGSSSILAVRVAGIALEDGRKNQQIRIRNSSSGKVINARVTATGQVRVGR